YIHPMLTYIYSLSLHDALPIYKITAKFPVRRNGKEIFAPFVATEPFIEFSDGSFSSNELSLGISKKFEHGLSADFFYINKYNRTSAPKYINGIGVSLTITLP